MSSGISQSGLRPKCFEFYNEFLQCAHDTLSLPTSQRRSLCKNSLEDLRECRTHFKAKQITLALIVHRHDRAKERLEELKNQSNSDPHH